MASLKGQVTYCLNSLQAYGSSRRQALRQGTAEQSIYSFRTMQTYCQLNVTFAEWCQDEHGARRLGDITPAMAEAFVASLRERALSPATINTYVCAIKKLDTGLRKLGWRRRNAEPFVLEFAGRSADAVPNPYSPENAEQLIAGLHKIDPQYGQVARLQRVSGLRVSEAVHLQAELIALDGSWVTLQGSGIHTKGGRPRRVPILPRHQPLLVQLRAQGLAHLDLHVFQQRQSLTAAVKRATSRLVARLNIQIGDGTHSLRKLYANELYQYLRHEKAMSDGEARQVVSQALGHNRLDVLKAYLAEVTISDPGHRA